jgi:NAD(P)H-hydrate epimerase
MSGAARLAGWGALRGGAGLVVVACPDAAQPLVAGDLACAITIPLPSRRGVLSARGAHEAREAAAAADVVAVGPGLTTGALGFLRAFLPGIRKPLLLDADALNCLADDPSLLAEVEGPRILTPHPGEAARLLGKPVQDRARAAEELAEKFGAVAVLKGAGTIVCDGERIYVNATGNPGMATGGSGDVLTGLLAARLASGTDPFVAAIQSVHVHGRAGDLAAASTGESSVIATDIVASLPTALEELKEPPPRAAKGGAGGSPARGSRRRR